MKMTFRWYGSAIDPIPLKYVKQIPGMSGLMGLLDKPAGVVWEEDEIKARPIWLCLIFIVGGAPITADFCKQIGADIYTPDAASAADAAVAFCKA